MAVPPVAERAPRRAAVAVRREIRRVRGPHAQRFEARVHGRLDRVDTGVGVVGSKYGSKSYSDEYGVPGTVQYQVVR